MRGRVCAAVVLIAAVTAPAASAEAPVRLDARHRDAVLTGHLAGASTYGPFYPFDVVLLDRTCFGSGCRDHAVVIVVRRGERATLDWSVSAPATGPGVDLRILDAEGRDLTRRAAAGIELQPPSTSAKGAVRPMRPGRYTVRVSLMAGVTDYTAKLRLTVA